LSKVAFVPEYEFADVPQLRDYPQKYDQRWPANGFRRDESTLPRTPCRGLLFEIFLRNQSARFDILSRQTQFLVDQPLLKFTLRHGSAVGNGLLAPLDRRQSRNLLQHVFIGDVARQLLNCL